MKEAHEVKELYESIIKIVEQTRNRVYKTINTEMVELYWNIGKRIVEKQEGRSRARYGESLLIDISKKLTNYFGKGFSEKNLERMRSFYICFPISTTLSSELSWSHYLILIKIKDNDKRNFYLQECINSRWSVRELERQVNTLLYERLIASKDKSKIKELSEVGNRVIENKDIIKDPFVLEFLDIKENTNYLENDLERSILSHLKEFLLELGKGFTFVGNQVRISIGSEHFYPDLVFYNRILNCFVIIDLKIGKVSHQDIGQMQMYVNYYDREIKKDTENKTIGILLSTNKNETIVKYTLPKDNNTIFSTEYRLAIPTDKEFIDIIEHEKTNIELT